jgi:Na+-transporting NADH:ubiquinone oxidoreductase subunit A
MAAFTIKKGLDIKLAGAPEPVVVDVPSADTISVFPSDLGPIKPRLEVQEGADVKRGSPLLHDKNNEALHLTSPAGGTVKSIVYGPRRALERIVIQVDPQEQVESYPRHQAQQVSTLSRDTLLGLLQQTGLLALLRQRPFGKVAQPATPPKSIFVNAAATAPFQADVNVMLKGRETAFQAGLDALTRLTDGKVHLCLDARGTNAPALTDAKNVQVHTFDGPHPSGNTSVHISRIDPLKPHDIVWTIKALDVLQIGHLLLNGEVPGTRVVSLAGHGVAEGQRKYYRVRIGQSLAGVLEGKLAAGEQRVLRGDVLAGEKTGDQDAVRLLDSGFTVIPEDRERHLLGWAGPGFNFFSASRAFASTWLGGLRKTWALGTNQHGELRPMVLTGLYDQYLPLNIMTDYLVRAVLANDTDEAIKLGILEVEPEDFALCALACPSKMDLMAIIRKGLQDIEKEGI